MEVKGNGYLLEVRQRGRDRVLSYNNVVFSKITEGTLYTHSYWDYFMPLPSIYNRSRILMIGLGGGTIIYQLSKLFKEKVSIDVVEVNRDMIKIFDSFVPEKVDVNVIIDDGTEYIKKSKGIYDIVILDAYIDRSIPGKFFQDEFVNDVYDSLKEDGVLAINYAVSLIGFAILSGYKRNLAKKFKVYLVNENISSGNIVILCSKSLNREEIISRIKKEFPENKDNAHLVYSYESMSQ